MTSFPMFPLGSVLFPHMPLQLRVFEERYVVMLSEILEEEPSEFGVVLIERGQEVGGGEKPFVYGTVAQILQLEAAEGFIAMVAQGDRRIEVVEWVDEAPYPRAVVRPMEELVWEDDLDELRATAEHDVRRALAIASEYADLPWAASVEISDDPVEAIWQLAAIAPLGPLDQIALLRSTTPRELLTGIIEHTAAALETLGQSWPTDGDYLDLDGEDDEDEHDDESGR
jgi:Lon protease-like protein